MVLSFAQFISHVGFYLTSRRIIGVFEVWRHIYRAL